MEDHLLIQLGKATCLRSKKRLFTSPRELRNLIFSINTKNFLFFEDDFGVSNGYVIWARVNRESINILKKENRTPLYIYEWEEGGYALILDLMFVDGLTRHNKRNLLEFLSKFRVIGYKRNNRISVFVRKNFKFKAIFRKHFMSSMRDVRCSKK